MPLKMKKQTTIYTKAQRTDTEKYIRCESYQQMLVPHLALIEHKLNSLLGPPAPTTAQQRVTWTETHLPTTPILDPWDPPARIARTGDGGFVLSPNVTCFQRGYCPQTAFDQYVDIYSVGFKSDRKSSEECIAGLAYDFLIVAKSTTQVTAGCMVEFRSSVDRRQSPYLYISSLCTHRDHCGRRLAQQIAHAVFTLGTLMLEQNSSANATWRDAIPRDKNLYVGLAVRKTFGRDTDKRLIKLYTECGLATRQMDPKIPRFDYKSFTHYSIYNWNLDYTDSIVSMWKKVEPGVLYCKEGRILNPSQSNGEPMYYEFQPEDLALVQASGIVHKQHAYLHPPGTVHVANTEEITFTKKAPVPGKGVFCIKTENIKTDRYTLKISVPAYFAASIHTQTLLQ